jgi:hypothetical protein
MSEVISFRLNNDKLREAQAFKVLEAWRSRGYSVRYVITEALLTLKDPGQESSANTLTDELNSTLNQVRKLLEQLGNGEQVVGAKQEEYGLSILTDTFMASIRKAAKPGVKIEKNKV